MILANVVFTISEIYLLQWCYQEFEKNFSLKHPIMPLNYHLSNLNMAPSNPKTNKHFRSCVNEPPQPNFILQLPKSFLNNPEPIQIKSDCYVYNPLIDSNKQLYGWEIYNWVAQTLGSVYGEENNPDPTASGKIYFFENV